MLNLFRYHALRICAQPLALLMATMFGFVCFGSAMAQGGIEYTGTGGKHTIEGRIYFSSGRKLDTPGVKVTLENSSVGSLVVFADSGGSFSFRNLTGGSYTVVIQGTDQYEGVRENVYIDDPGSSNIRGASLSVAAPARIFIVPIYLLPKRHPGTRAGVVDASMASVPKPALNLYYKAVESIRAGDYKKAITELESAVGLYPQFPQALNELGVQYLKGGQLDKASQTLQSAVRLAPDEFVPRLNYGIALLEKRDFVGAETQLREALKRNDAAPTAHLYLGITLINERNYDEAEKEFQRAITLGGENMGQAYYYLGGLYWRKNQYQQAADALEKYLRSSPKAADAERIRATIKELRDKR